MAPDPQTAITRVFLGWSEPFLPAVVDYLRRRYASGSNWSMDTVTIALPAARAARRLLELLIYAAQQHGLALLPPRILTIGALVDLLYVRPLPAADRLVRHLAWAREILSCEKDQLARLTAVPPPTDDLSQALDLAATVDRLHEELAADGLEFGDVARAQGDARRERESLRWRTLADVQSRYFQSLESLEFCDPQSTRLDAVRGGRCRADFDVVLAGASDLNAIQRQALDQVAPRVTALVFAPQSEERRFDAHGALVPSQWLEAPIELSDEQWTVADGPAEQAAAAVECLARLPTPLAADEIVVGVPDAEVVPFVEQALKSAGAPCRYAVGRPIARTPLAMLLTAIAEFIEGRTYARFSALLRHPHMEEWIRRVLPRPPEGVTVPPWIECIDTYASEHLPLVVDGNWIGPLPEEHPLPRIQQALDRLLAPLLGTARPADEWAPALTSIVVEILGDPTLLVTAPGQRETAISCQEFAGCLQAMMRIPESLMPRLTGAEAVHLALGILEGRSVPPAADEQAIELLGWLELPHDDAPALVVTGFNERFVPSASNSDAWLPNALRAELGLLDNDRRYARDAYALSAILASRPFVRLIAGRRSAEGDPHLPSRLLFACPAGVAASRIRTFYGASGPRRRPAGPRPGAKEPFSLPRPKPLEKPITSLRVTAFREYIACPYRFYLKNVLGLRPVEPPPDELDPRAFGNLAHDVLEAFAKSDVAGSDDEEVIRKWLEGDLARLTLERYGKTRPPAAEVQIDHLRVRLGGLARWQAQWRAQGWRIKFAEIDLTESKVSLDVDRKPFFLRGRIDRIDVNDSTGEGAILDYKTGEGGLGPDKTHRSSDGESWIDLQLPLYRHLSARLDLGTDLKLGYVVVPKAASRVGVELAPWTADDLEKADEAARKVVRGLRNERFWPPTSPPPEFFEELAGICQDKRFSGGEPIGADEDES
jgi:hypothetical protein